MLMYFIPVGQRTIFVLTKVDLAEKQGIKQEKVKCIHKFSLEYKLLYGVESDSSICL